MTVCSDYAIANLLRPNTLPSTIPAIGVTPGTRPLAHHAAVDETSRHDRLAANAPSRDHCGVLSHADVGVRLMDLLLTAICLCLSEPRRDRGVTVTCDAKTITAIWFDTVRAASDTSARRCSVQIRSPQANAIVLIDTRTAPDGTIPAAAAAAATVPRSESASNGAGLRSTAMLRYAVSVLCETHC